MGTISTTITDLIQNVTTTADILVVPNKVTPILGSRTAITLNLRRVGSPDRIAVIEDEQSSLSTLLSKYEDRFTGLGKLKDTDVKVHINSRVTPVVQKARRLPILIQKEVDHEIDKLLESGVIEKVPKPPSWVNQLVVVPKKNGGLRVCVDMRIANSAIIREPYQILTLDEIVHEFNGCTKFTTLDLNQGYHQL